MAKLFKSWRTVSKLILAIVACIIAVAASYLIQQPAQEELNLSVKSKHWFTYSPILTNVKALFDLGVVDINSDNFLDIFTSNHSDKQYLLLGEGSGKFTDNAISQFGLDQQPEFPGLEPSGDPLIKASGLYIFWQGRNLVIKNYHTDKIDSLSGSIDLSAPMEVIQESSYTVEIKEDQLSTGATASTTKFTAQSHDGRLVLGPFNQAIPISFKLNDHMPLEQVYIGNQRVNPKSHDFVFYLRDRHGMAWADLDGKGMIDVFAVRGGLRARMKTLPERYTDELLFNHDGLHYEESADRSGIIKDGCPALQTAWVDYDNDSLLDLYTVCFKPARSTESDYPNQLYRQQSEGKFLNVAADVNLDIPNGGSFVWLDADRDGDLDFFWVDSEAFWLYVNQSGKFEPQLIGSNPGNVTEKFGDSNKLTISDYDADGYLDIFFASSKGNALLTNTDGTYKVVKPTEMGLPARGLTANWVDYDNDGLMDLHVVPGGLYRQHQDHLFEATHLLESKSAALVEAISTWFDANNDGSRDLLIATKHNYSYKEIFNKIFSKIFQKSLIKDSISTLVLYPNIGATNHWLEIKLVGPRGNRPAIGAQVEVVTPNGVQLQAVGQSEGSHFSQGHYRLYFGLGQHQNVDSIKVFWSDGYVQELKNIPSDQLLTLKRMLVN
ncbi:MAG: CRTAC1 family protein [Pleurocapsa sp. MO_192.B19]|nr:CRTAC1 family protein [Pleurocapsa sp. MO_192.B19]